MDPSSPVRTGKSSGRSARSADGASGAPVRDEGAAIRRRAAPDQLLPNQPPDHDAVADEVTGEIDVLLARPLKVPGHGVTIGRVNGAIHPSRHDVHLGGP